MQRRNQGHGCVAMTSTIDGRTRKQEHVIDASVHDIQIAVRKYVKCRTRSALLQTLKQMLSNRLVCTTELGSARISSNTESNLLCVASNKREIMIETKRHVQHVSNLLVVTHANKTTRPHSDTQANSTLTVIRLVLCLRSTRSTHVSISPPYHGSALADPNTSHRLMKKKTKSILGKQHEQ
jgi:hypothetical protein